MKNYLIHSRPDLVRLINIFRYELTSRWAVWSRRLTGGGWNVARRFRGAEKLRLNLASGGMIIPGWLSVDVGRDADVRADLRDRIPLNDNSVTLIFCEHFADHLAFPAGIRRFLSECHRVLELGGRVRFVLHDAEGLLKAYVAKDATYFEVAQEVFPTMMESVNKLFRFNGFHLFLYDFETFQKALLEAGFSAIERRNYLDSDIPELILDFKHPSREIMSMYVEALK